MGEKISEKISDIKQDGFNENLELKGKSNLYPSKIEIHNVDKEMSKKIKEMLEKQLDLLSKLSVSETNIQAVCELSSTMCQVANLLQFY